MSDAKIDALAQQVAAMQQQITEMKQIQIQMFQMMQQKQQLEVVMNTLKLAQDKAMADLRLVSTMAGTSTTGAVGAVGGVAGLTMAPVGMGNGVAGRMSGGAGSLQHQVSSPHLGANRRVNAQTGYTTVVNTAVMRGTVLPKANHNPEGDAKELRKSMKGLGTNEKKIIQILAQRTNQQRQAVKAAYSTMFPKRELVADLRSETSSNLKDLLTYMTMTPAEFDAWSLHDAIAGLGTTDSTLIEILCSRTNKEIAAIKVAYQEKYKRDLERDVSGDTSGDYKKLMLKLCAGVREENKPVDVARAKREAASLYGAGEDKIGTNEEVFIDILTTSSIAQLRLLLDEYNKISDYALEVSIAREMSFNLKNALVTICRLVRDAPDFFADRLHNAMKGLGTRDLALMRVVLSRSEVDLANIKDAYFSKYQQTLAQRIRSETSGDYRRLLVAIVGEDSLDPEADAKLLRKALKGLGTDEEKLMLVLGGRTVLQRQAIRHAYNTMYNRDLVADLKSDTSGNFKELIVAMMLPGPAYDAWSVHQAIKGLGTDDATLVEIVCTRTNKEIKLMKEAYQEQFKTDVESAVRGDTSGDYRQLLMSLLQATRDEGHMVDMNKAKADAASLYKAGEDKVGTDEECFIRIFSQRSWGSLAATFDFYNKISDKDILKAVKDETSFNFKKALQTIVRCVRDPSVYFAERFEKAMAGMGTNDADLQRLVVTRAEVDLTEVKQEYKNKFQKSLAVSVEKETSGSYRKLLLKVIEACDDYVVTTVDAQRPNSLVGPSAPGTAAGSLSQMHSGSTASLPQAGGHVEAPPPAPTTAPPRRT